MRGRTPLAVAFLTVLWLMSCPYPPAFAELAPGTVIDKTNAEQAQGLIPDPVLNWVKKGDGSMTVGELPYNPDDFLPPPAKAYLESNKGKYDVDAEGLIVDLKTGKLPEFIDGMPFPEIDPADPNAGEKIMYNKHYYSYAVGPIQVPFQVSWVGRKTGFEREIIMDYWTYLLDGYPPAREESNPENVEMHSLIIALAPYDIKGTNILLWRYRNDRLDSTFAYVPAIRRVRRMSPANRSDSFLGSDFCVDDAWGYGGKINTFNWKLIEKKDQLIPFIAGPPIKLTKNDVGEWVSHSGDRTITYGYQDGRVAGGALVAHERHHLCQSAHIHSGVFRQGQVLQLWAPAALGRCGPLDTYVQGDLRSIRRVLEGGVASIERPSDGRQDLPDLGTGQHDGL